MNIGIVSDVHGDYDALVTSFERLDHVHQVDEILCAGDLVGRGPEQDRVVELIRKRNIPTVKGNHDEWFHGLSTENSNFLRKLPIDWRGEVGGFRVFMCHGKPGNNLWGLYKDHVSKTYLKMMMSSLKADILITGHTHVPLCMRLGQKCVINPGSLFTFKSSRGTSHTYGVLSLPEMDFQLFDVMTASPVSVELEEYTF